MHIGKSGVVTVEVAETAGGGGAISLAPGKAQKGLEWRCRSTLLPKYLPAGCRGDGLPLAR